MEQWEHLVVTLPARVTEQQRMRQPEGSGRPLPKYTPQALIPRLDEYGAQGWELVSAQPVLMGVNGDITYEYGDDGKWTHTYLCFFKRRKQTE